MKDAPKKCYLCKQSIAEEEDADFRSYYGYFHRACIKDKFASRGLSLQSLVPSSHGAFRSNRSLLVMIMLICGLIATLVLPEAFPMAFGSSGKDFTVMLVVFVIGAICGIFAYSILSAILAQKKKTNI